MLVYTLKQIVQGIATVWFVATATFVAMHAVPGDPLANQRATSAEIHRNLQELYGLDKPVPLQDGSIVVADERYIRDSILLPRSQVAAGYVPLMPSFAGRISEDELIRLVAYIKSLARE